MANDAVRNQKVFVTLESVLELQAKYHQAVNQHKVVPANTETSTAEVSRKARINAFEQVIRLLGLPITIGAV